MKHSTLISIIKEVLQENNSLTEEKILIPRRTPEERRRNFIKATQQKIQQYIKNGSKGDLDLSNTPITSLPDNLTRVGGRLYLRNTPITSLPDNLTVGGDLDLYNTKITKLPDNLKVGGYLDLNSTPITSLPDNLTVGGWLYINNTPITSLPDNLTVGGDLNLNYTSITTLPDNLNVGGNLDLYNTKITSLPDNLTVGGSLNLNYTSITTLPDNLTVGGSLDLRNTKITTIPASAKITGEIYGLKNESIMKKEELKEIIREYILEIKNKPDFEEELKKAYQAYLDTKGKELEEYFSNQVVKLLDLYKSKTGKDHPLSKKVDMIAENKLSYDELKKRKNKIEKSELKQLIKECLKEVDPASGGPVDVNLDETTDIDFETNWDKSSISELLDSVGQDKIKYYSSVKGISLGDWGTVKFSCDFGNHEVLYLEFEDEKLAKQALNSFSHALSNPYEFSSRFDKMPRIIMVRIID